METMEVHRSYTYEKIIYALAVASWWSDSILSSSLCRNLAVALGCADISTEDLLSTAQVVLGL